MGRQGLPRRLLLAPAGLALALVLAAPAAAADAPLVTATQTLVGLNDVAGGGFEPPDVQVAAGAGYVVEVVNLAQRVWRTGPGGAVEVASQPLSSVFGSGGDSITDPRILYDAPSGRWLASISDLDRRSILLAVSAASDPTGRWTVSSLAAGGCADQPRLGVADGVVVVGADVFQSCEDDDALSTGSELWIVNKQELLAGNLSPAFATYGPNPDRQSLTPVQSLSPTATEYVVSVDEPNSRVARLFTVDGIPPAPVHVEEVAAPPIAALTHPPFAAQPPSSRGRPEPLIQTNDDRVLDAVWEDGKLWFAANTGCIPVGDLFPRACARIVELSTVTRTVDWDTDLGEKGLHVFFPALRPDAAGNLVIVAAESGSQMRPSLVAVARTPDGTLTAPVVVAQSAGPFVGGRYGDYFGAARDPADPNVVWVAGEAGTDVVGGRGWSTSVASVVVTGAGGSPPAVLGAPPPGVRPVAAVVTVDNAVRLAYRALDDGLNVRTVLAVRSRKAVLFRTTTRKSTLHVEQAYYVLWRPKKRLRGRFTYCVHSISPSGVQSPESCVAVLLR